MALGEKVFEKRARQLVPTEMGRLVYRYADEIFSLGRELVDTVKGRPTGQPVRLLVGVVDAVPKIVARMLLEPAWSMPEPLRLECYEGKLEPLLAELSLYGLDVVISDTPLPTGSIVPAYRKFAFQLTTPGGKNALSAARAKLGGPLGTTATDMPPAVGSTFISSPDVNLNNSQKNAAQAFCDANFGVGRVVIE